MSARQGQSNGQLPGDSLRSRRPADGSEAPAGSNHTRPPPLPPSSHGQDQPAARPRQRVVPRDQQGSSSHANGSGANDRAKSNVGGKLLEKRRSVVGHRSGWQDEPAPAMPSGLNGLPSNPASGLGISSSSQPGAMYSSSSAPRDAYSVVGFDADTLSAETFRPEDFLKQNLISSKADDEQQTGILRQFKQRLEQALKITESELQQSVFKNYADFVLISKEIATLENEMLDLKSVLEEWRTVPESLEGGWGDDDLLLGGSTGSNRRNQRNSIADVATLYKAQLSALWEGVEGAQKLLPYVPGRHLIAESASFVELNSATYKPKQPVHLFLLNDAMLVSVKKRRGGTGAAKVRLVAERCFNLSEIIVVDLKDGGDLNNAVKIKRGKETIIFRTDKAEDKKALLMAFKKVAEELMNKRRKEMLSEAEARKGESAVNHRMSRIMDYDGTMLSSGFNPAEMLGFGKDDPSGKDLSWIGDYSDELAVNIAMRSFDEAVVLIEKGKAVIPNLAADPHASLLFRTKLDQRSAELVASLLKDLADHAIRKTGVVRTTSWLLRLGQGEKARETFLHGRGTLVRRRARQIKFEGDISMYISELAMVCFTLIKNTCEWYMAAFKDNRMASGFVRWASEQVEIYAEMFRRQVYGPDQDDKVISESLQVTKAHGAMLRDVGLDFTFLLDSLLRPDPTQEPAPAPTGAGATIADTRAAERRGGNTGFSGGLRVPGQKGARASAVAYARQSLFMMNSTSSTNGGAAGAPAGRQQGVTGLGLSSGVVPTRQQASTPTPAPVSSAPPPEVIISGNAL